MSLFPCQSTAGKVYVQDLLWDARHELVPLILEKRAYIYICGDAKNMAHSVEQKLMAMLGEAKGGSAEVEGAKEFKLLKERQVSGGCKGRVWTLDVFANSLVKRYAEALVGRLVIDDACAGPPALAKHGFGHLE